MGEIRKQSAVEKAFALNEAGAVFHVSAEGVKEGIKRIIAQLRFGPIGWFELREAFAERIKAVEYLYD